MPDTEVSRRYSIKKPVLSEEQWEDWRELKSSDREEAGCYGRWSPATSLQMRSKVTKTQEDGVNGKQKNGLSNYCAPTPRNTGL